MKKQLSWKIIPLAILCTIVWIKCSYGQNFIVTAAGNGTGGYSGDGGLATSAEIYNSWGVGVDVSGNIYIADGNNNRIRKVFASTGIITTIAGNGSAGYSGDGGAASLAELNNPTGVFVDNAGNVFIADKDNHCIRKIDANTSIISTIVGNGFAGFSGDGGPAAAAQLNTPYKVVTDDSSNIYIADYSNNRIRKITASTGIITTIAGNGIAGFSGDGGPATSAELYTPPSMVLDTSGNIYIADGLNYRIRKISAATGIITTIAGTGSGSFSGDGGPATAAGLDGAYGVALDKTGNIFITEYNDNRVRRIDAVTGIITTVAGNGSFGFAGDNGPAASAEFRGAYGIAIDGANNIFITDIYNNRIRKITGSMVVNIVTTNLKCFNDLSTDSAVVTGGQAPFQYSWSNGMTTQKISATAGNYAVTVTDNFNHTATCSITISQPTKITTSTSVTSSSASVNVTGGTPTYSYSWSNGMTTSTISGLSNGKYYVTVYDMNGCFAKDSATVGITAIPGYQQTREEVQLYPNPVINGILTVLHGERMDIIEIYNLLGEKVMQIKAVTKIDMSGLEKGVYFVKLRNANEEKVCKVLVQ